MMTATWVGRSCAAGTSTASCFTCAPIADASDLEDFLFFGGHGGLDVGDTVVGDLLHLLESTLEIVFGDGLFFFGLFEHLVGVAAGVADGDFGVFTPGFGLLDDVFAPLLGELRDGQPD